MQLRFLFNATFRANPAYALCELSRLNQPEQAALAGLLTGTPDVFGVFKPVAADAAHTPKVAYKDVALLFYALQRPGPLPQFVKQVYDDDLNATLAKLVLEDVLQLEHDGAFVSGTDAAKFLYNSEHETGIALKGIALLSQQAIQYVLQLNDLDFSAALFRLYSYNTIPLTLAAADVDTTEAVETFLSIGEGSALRKKIAQHWSKNTSSQKQEWLSFHRKDSAQRSRKNAPTYKLYISPLLSYLPWVFEKVVHILPATKAFAYKTGCHRQGLLRPDKFVVYFQEHRHLLEAAALLKEALKDVQAQGVPFTAQLDDTGLLSWGIDPPAGNVIDGLEGGSRRAQLTEKLAAAIVQAKTAQLSKTEAYQFIVNRIALERIDPYTWMPEQPILN